MKEKILPFLCVLLIGISLFWAVPGARAVQIVPGDTQHTSFWVVTVPIPKCLPRPLVTIILQVIGRVWPNKVIKDPVFLERAGNMYYDAQFAMLPASILSLMKFANTYTEDQSTTFAGRICVYVNGALDPISEETLSDTRFKTVSPNPYNRIGGRSGIGIPAAWSSPLYTISREEYDRTKETLLVDVENQLPCDAASPRDTKHDYDDPRQDENKFIPGFAQAIVSWLEQICRTCPDGCCPCTDYELYFKGTGLGGWDGTYMALVGTHHDGSGSTPVSNASNSESVLGANTSGSDSVMESYLKQVNYPILPKEKQAGKVISELPASLEILHSGELPTGGSILQPMCSELKDCVHTPQSSQYAQSFLIYGTLADSCAKVAESLQPDYFKNVLDDNPETPLDESKNACSRNLLKGEGEAPVETYGNTLGKEVPEQKPINLDAITPASDAPKGDCADNMPATADEFLTYLRQNNILWPNYDNIRTHYNDIINASKKAGIDPGLAMAIWIEESGAGRAGAQFGCTKLNPDFETQLGCFVNLWNTYATDSRFEECRGDDKKLNMKEFMLIYSGGYLDCRSGNFDREPKFPEKIKDWYDKVTKCTNGLHF